ncbi:hypothetical protein K4K61_009699 [Colletotrichum sp. SAR11_59]|nr:hypothetical protein K4K61_009699 [Colletotrichum sp. SAR11_59]
MQTLASDLEYVLLNKLVPFEVDEDELHALVDDTVAHVNKLLPRWLKNTHYDQNGSGNDKENDGQTTPQKRKADEVFNTNDDKIVGSPRKKPWEQDSIAETGFLGTADEPGPDKEAGEEMDMDKAKNFPMSELDQNMDFKYEKPEMDDEEQDDLKTDAEQELYQARMLK